MDRVDAAQVAGFVEDVVKADEEPVAVMPVAVSGMGQRDLVGMQALGDSGSWEGEGHGCVGANALESLVLAVRSALQERMAVATAERLPDLVVLVQGITAGMEQAAAVVGSERQSALRRVLAQLAV